MNQAVLILEIVLLIPFFFGLYIGCSAVFRPASRPNFDRSFKRRYKRSEWNDLNPELYTRNRGLLVLLCTTVYGVLILVPWLLR